LDKEESSSFSSIAPGVFFGLAVGAALLSVCFLLIRYSWYLQYSVISLFRMRVSCLSFESIHTFDYIMFLAQPEPLQHHHHIIRARKSTNFE